MWKTNSPYNGQCTVTTHTHTHTHTFSSPLSRTTRYQKGKTNLDFTKARETVSGSGISWAICKSAPRSRQITMPAPHHSALKARALKAHVKALRHYTVTNTVDYLQRQLATTSKYSRSPSLYFRRISSKYVNASFRVHIYSKLSCPPVASSRPHWENFIVHTADCKYKACVKSLDIKMTNPGNKLEQCDTATAAYNWHTPLMLCILLTKKSHEISNSLQSIAKAGCNGNKTDITSHNNWYKTHTHTPV